jgi:hypothetical protein
MSTRKTPAAKSKSATKAPANMPKSAPARPSVTAKSAKPAKAAAVGQDVKAARPGKPPRPAKSPKVRSKPVRDSFTMPESDFSLIATLKARALAAQRETKKSELLRAGLHALAALDTPALVAVLGRLEPVKIGRPKQGH